MAIYGESLPVYTDPGTPGRLSLELQEKTRDVRFREWYDQLKSFETPHKKLSDLGRGLVALGVGSLLALGLWRFYERMKPERRAIFFLITWCGIWAIRIPSSYWYYMLRQRRFDYPSWGDSVAIPIFSDIFAWMIDCVVLGVILILLMVRHRLPETIQWRKPKGWLAWVRYLFLTTWILFFLLALIEGVSDGDEGMVISNSTTLPLILVVLWACPTSRKQLEITAELPHDGDSNNLD